MEPKRLFDCIDWQLQHHPKKDMLAAKEGGQWKMYSTSQVKDIVDKLSAGLSAMGIGAGDMSTEGRDKIAVLSKNRPEWIFLDLAIQQMGAILTPIYPTVHVSDLEFVLNDAQVKMVFVNDEDLFLKVQSVRNKVPSLQEVFSFEHVPGCRHWKEILTKGTDTSLEKIKATAAKITGEDLLTIIYTSGTTGTPKGVMLTHNNVMSNVQSSLNCVFFEMGISGRKALSFLPLNHIFERMISYVYLFSGTGIYYAESLDTIGDNLKEVKPQVFATVPRLLEKVYEKIMAKANLLTGIKKKLFFWALDLAQQFEINKSKGLWYNLQLGIANKLVFSKWREGLGNELKCIVTGAAACQVKLIRIFTAAKIPILEGYGQTESSPVISVNRLNEKGRMFGTVGPVIDGVEVKIAEDGEILSRGPHVMPGYYKRPDLTAETIINGWLHTGDIGMMVENPKDPSKKFLKITDRKKEIFKTSGGKYVAPQPIENKMVESPFIEQVMVVGAEQKFAGALIVPAFQVISEWAQRHGLHVGSDPAAIIRDEKVLEHFRDVVEEINKNFNPVEQIKKFELLTHAWSVEGGELTPTLKLKRKVIQEKYKNAIQRIYN
jgi:long-chain acyl-CoA synthetase